VKLFAEFFQDLYVSEGEPVLLPTIDTLPDEKHEEHKVSLVQLTQTTVEKAILGLDEQKGPGTDGISRSILRKSVCSICSICSYQLEFFLLFRKTPFSFRSSRMARNGISLAIRSMVS
jgi:hypothetical protein